ncbi:NAD(P)-binding Rossmann-fold superfamily protein [Euphorbia peplus]|nr:NAD(P)-binding Rossmann-fold superfamily protein [Euphorbia peplus]
MIFGRKGPSGFSTKSTAEEVTQGIDGSSLTAIITGASSGIGAETARVLAMRAIAMIPFTLSEDDIELQFATNHVGHFLLTELLLETMKNTTRESNQEGRIVNVSSEGHNIAYPGGIRFGQINDQSGYRKDLGYSQSKLANILHANELARRLKEDGVDITANSLHPGGIVTNIVRHHKIIYGITFLLDKFLLKNCQQGAATTCYVALHPQLICHS